MSRAKKDIVLAPLEDGNQKYAIRSNADIVCFTGATGSGKTYALYYALADYLSQNDNAKTICFMRNVSDFWGAGKVNDTLKKMYPLIDRSVKKQPRDPVGEIIRNQVDMGMKLYNGSELKFQQLDNESPTVIDKIAKGMQAKKLVFDECNKFDWRTITAFMPRLRSDSKGKAQIFLAQNPERECFMRQLCGKGEHGGGWINDDGSLDKSMDGVVMYFNMQEGDLNKTYFGRTKREVYEKCKSHIDSLLSVDKDMSYEDFILSMVFFSFSVRDNKRMLEKNKSYRGLAANSSTALSSYNENWNYSITDDEKNIEELSNAQVSSTDVERMFRKREMPYNGELLKRFMTVDMATTGFDNLVMKYWELWSHYGFICKDIKFSIKNSNREAVIMISQFRDSHRLDDNNMILDVQGFGFLRDCFPKAILFSGAGQPSVRSKSQYKTLKDEAAHIAMEMIHSDLIHYEPHLANERYYHQNMKRAGATTIMKHMKFESAIFQFNKTPNGRIAMLNKEEQKKFLKGMSPDLFDNLIMLCGGAYFDCYRILSTDAGARKKKMQAEDMLSFLNVGETNKENETLHIRKKIHHSNRILNLLSAI